MIESSIKKSEGGTKIANDTAEALNKIVSEVEAVTNLINSIAVATNEQAAGIDQINQGIMQVSDVVQNNSSTSEEGAAASEELSSQAIILKEMVGKYKLKDIRKSSFGNIEELNPEVLQMLEKMAQKKKQPALDTQEPVKVNKATAKKKISLNDTEFGKY
jgi:methyl-accepting chemotaxis protein